MLLQHLVTNHLHFHLNMFKSSTTKFLCNNNISNRSKTLLDMEHRLLKEDSVLETNMALKLRRLHLHLVLVRNLLMVNNNNLVLVLARRLSLVNKLQVMVLNNQLLTDSKQLYSQLALVSNQLYSQLALVSNQVTQDMVPNRQRLVMVNKQLFRDSNSNSNPHTLDNKRRQHFPYNNSPLVIRHQRVRLVVNKPAMEPKHNLDLTDKALEAPFQELQLPHPPLAFKLLV